MHLCWPSEHFSAMCLWHSCATKRNAPFENWKASCKEVKGIFWRALSSCIHKFPKELQSSLTDLCLCLPELPFVVEIWHRDRNGFTIGGHFWKTCSIPLLDQFVILVSRKLIIYERIRYAFLVLKPSMTQFFTSGKANILLQCITGHFNCDFKVQYCWYMTGYQIPKNAWKQ